MTIALHVALMLSALAFWPLVWVGVTRLVEKRERSRVQRIARRYPGPWTA